MEEGPNFEENKMKAYNDLLIAQAITAEEIINKSGHTLNVMPFSAEFLSQFAKEYYKDAFEPSEYEYLLNCLVETNTVIRTTEIDHMGQVVNVYSIRNFTEVANLNQSADVQEVRYIDFSTKGKFN